MLIENVSYDINWKNFKAGTSFFIPCLDCNFAKKHVLEVTKRLKIDVMIKISIEDNIKGLRIWRV
jgi:hypothetical protein